MISLLIIETIKTEQTLDILWKMCYNVIVVKDTFYAYYTMNNYLGGVSMKKVKKSIVAALTAATAISAVPVINSTAAQAASNEPKMYLDFVIESDGDIRADVVIENMPEFDSCGFHVVLGEGLKFSKSTEGREVVSLGNPAMRGYNRIGDHEVALTMSDLLFENEDKRLVGFYVERTAVNNAFNSTANLEFRNTGNSNDYFANSKTNTTIYSAVGNVGSIYTPEMLESNEYLVGDVDGNGIINASDTSHVLRQIKYYGTKKISDFNGDYNDAIEDLRGAYAADVNKDGYITQEDADLILRYYTLMMSDKPYDGEIGKIDIYEIYND